MIDVSSKVALITGGSGGQGRAHARVLSGLSATGIITDINEQDVVRCAQEIGGNVTGLVHDITSANDWARVLATVESLHGR